MRIERDNFENREEFHEDWAQFGPHIGKKFTVTIFYGSSPVLKEYVVAVDDSRADIPMPDIETHSLTPYEYQLGKILNIASAWNYDKYLRRTDVTVEH